MMNINIFMAFIVLVSAINCKPSPVSSSSESKNATTEDENFEYVNPQGKTIGERIQTPPNYERAVNDKSSLASYLRNIKLKPNGSLVQYYDGRVKSNNGVYVAVADLLIGDKDLHQCADAVMRLRAEYLWRSKKYEDIHFNFTNGHKVKYTEWMKGKRMQVKGNKTKWVQKEKPSNTYQDFWNYMELIFTYAGTASLSKELVSKKIDDIKIGDVFINGGFPGHAVIVVDMARHNETGEAIFLLAQSYMPAQDLQILENPNSHKLGPWYKLSSGEKLLTPEWTFLSGSLKYFENR